MTRFLAPRFVLLWGVIYGNSLEETTASYFWNQQPFLTFGAVEPLLTDTSLLQESMLTSKGDLSFFMYSGITSYNKTNMQFYHINIIEIPGELSSENVISLSSHVKITALLWLHNNLCLSQRKMKWFGLSLVFI